MGESEWDRLFQDPVRYLAAIEHVEGSQMDCTHLAYMLQARN